MNNELEEKLNKIGLTNHEASIYKTLILNSPATASFIAKKCNLSRSSVYTSISSLISKGLVGTTFKNEVKQFVVQGGSTLENMLQNEREILEEKFNILKEVRNQIREIGIGNLDLPKIMTFEGQEGLIKIFMSMLRHAEPEETMYVLRSHFVWDPEWKFIFEDRWHNRVKRWKSEKNIKTKLILNPSTTEKDKVSYYKKKRGLEFKFLPKNKSVKNFAIYIMSDTVSILSIEKNNLVGIKITNKHISLNFKNIFELLWQN